VNVKSNEFGMQVYLRPLFRQLSLRQSRTYALEHARQFLRWLLPSRFKREQSEPLSQVRAYQPPQLTKLTPEQAKLKLLGCLSVGEQGAKDLLDLLFAGPAGMDKSQRQPAQTPENSLRAG
jgi:hypothetical protein